jgi:hypothetical protein
LALGVAAGFRKWPQVLKVAAGFESGRRFSTCGEQVAAGF